MLKCTAAYPAKKEDANLLKINDMKSRYNVVGGLSDHTLGIEVPTTSVAMGASVIEKHFTISRKYGECYVNYCQIGRHIFEMFNNQDEHAHDDHIIPLNRIGGSAYIWLGPNTGFETFKQKTKQSRRGRPRLLLKASPYNLESVSYTHLTLPTNREV